VNTRAILILVTLVACANPVAAEFPQQAQVYLVDNDQKETRIGDIGFTEVGDGSAAIQVQIDTEVFNGHFLSMRPFNCLEGETEWFCYLEYPYDLRSTVTPTDLSDLEYQLLFILKRTSEFGIDAWNGLYYKLELESNGEITGTLFEGDLNSLQSPPSEKYAKPVDLNEFIPADKSRLFPRLRIY